tara:strand:- start:2315 stop:4183 length:1869 start_codon:yes stop_codon:yes gene_type:complete
MKFSDLVTELRADIWPEGVPESLTAPIGKNFEAAVTHLQRYIPCLQSRNINRYAQCSTYFQGGKTVIDAPKGRINKVYTILDTAGEEVYPAVFRQVTKEELECNSLKLLSLVYPPKNIQTEDPLPMGFKYPEEDSDYKVNTKGEKLATKHGRAVIGQWAIDRDRIYISPWINSNEVVVVEWNGVKTRFGADDGVIEDIDFKRAVRLFVQREFARDFDNDYERYRYMSVDFDMAMGDLIHECKKQTELKTTFFCPESYDILAARRDKRYREIKTATTAVDAAEAAVTAYTFAVIGDYGASVSGNADPDGYNGTNASAVATLVKGWSPDFIITTGDNSYNSTGGDTSGATQYDTNIGQWYADFIYPYGTSGMHLPANQTATLTQNKFFPAIGNHDLTEAYGTTNAGLALYKSYFTLLGNEEYYRFRRGQVEFFCLWSNKVSTGTPPTVYDSKLGVGLSGIQHEWLESALDESKREGSHWRVVYFHHSPYSTESGGSHTTNRGDTDMRWDFAGMGADVVISGHAHNYERLKDANDFRYLVCGASGAPLRSTQVASGSNYGLPTSGVPGTSITTEKFYGDDWGAIRGTVADTELKFEFINKAGTVVDTYTMTKTLSDPVTTRTVTA